MGISIGGIDLADSVINAEFRIGVLERIVDRLLRVAPAGTLTEQDMKQIREAVISDLQKRYPDAGIKPKGEQAEGGKRGGV